MAELCEGQPLYVELACGFDGRNVRAQAKRYSVAPRVVFHAVLRAERERLALLRLSGWPMRRKAM